jgi:hypothetical protein
MSRSNIHVFGIPEEERRKNEVTGCWWLTPVILATQKAEIRRVTVQSQLRQIVCEILSQKYPT